jgi:hypothetical protein
MFKPSRHNREELPSEPVKPTPTFTPKPVSPEDIALILTTIKAENPTLANTDRNGDSIRRFLVENHCEVTLENCRKAVLILSYPFDKLDRQKPPAPTPPPPPPVVEEPVEVLEPGQLSLKCSKWELEHASKEQVKDWLQRAREAGMK